MATAATTTTTHSLSHLLVDDEDLASVVLRFLDVQSGLSLLRAVRSLYPFTSRVGAQWIVARAEEDFHLSKARVSSDATAVVIWTNRDPLFVRWRRRIESRLAKASLHSFQSALPPLSVRSFPLFRFVVPPLPGLAGLRGRRCPTTLYEMETKMMAGELSLHSLVRSILASALWIRAHVVLEERYLTHVATPSPPPPSRGANSDDLIYSRPDLFA